MGKLYGTRTYLVGAMDRVPDGGKSWRNKITPMLHNLGVMVYNPCDKPIDNPEVVENKETRSKIQYLKSLQKFDEIRDTYGSIRAVDLRMVDTSDFLIANIDIDVHACGTYEEITTANRQKKPILVYIKQGVEHIPNWLTFMLPGQHFFDNWSALTNYLMDINEGHVKDETGRWVFFDMEKEISAINRSKNVYMDI